MKKLAAVLILLSMVLGVTAFQCSSTEMTSAKLYIQQKNLPKAKEALLKEIKKNPKSDEGFYLLGYIYGEEGNYEEMISSYDKSLAISKKYAQQIADSKKYHWANNFNKGVALFNKAGQTNDKDSTAAFFDQSIQAFNYAIMCEPDSADTYRNLVFSYLNAGKTDEALLPLKKIIELDPDADSYSMIGQIYNTKGMNLAAAYKNNHNPEDSVKSVENYNIAVDYLEQARKLFPDNNDILLQLSNAYIGADKLDVAMSAFKAGVEKEPENKFYRYNYGVLLLGSENFDAAAQQFEKAVQIDPEYVNAIYNLAVTYVKWGTKIREDAEAKEDYENQEYKEKFKLALPYLEKYLEIKPEESVIWDLLGKVYANLGMTEKSKAAFEKADQYR